jgi:predicted enzyme related to lactoylglutathione lyase
MNGVVATRLLIAVVLAAPVAALSHQSLAAKEPRTVAAGEFVWHDLLTSDASRARTFYGSLFGWTFEAGDGVDPGYTIIKHDGIPIGGIVPRARPTNGEPFVAQWITYVAVADVDAVVERFRNAGGRVFRGPVNARKGLRVAVVADPQGAPLGLSSQGRAVDEARPPAVHRWLWMDYVARDPAAALAFYRDAVGYTHEAADTREEFTYYLLKTDRPHAGLFLSPWTRDTSAWLPYVRVADPSMTAARAVELGGTLAVPPRREVRNGSLAIILDPSGAPVAVQKFPFDGGTP